MERMDIEGRLKIPRLVVDPLKRVRAMKVDIRSRDVRKVIENLKDRKPGVDGMKPEMYKALKEMG